LIDGVTLSFGGGLYRKEIRNFESQPFAFYRSAFRFELIYWVWVWAWAGRKADCLFKLV
jgi:hypothetical protein